MKPINATTDAQVFDLKSTVHEIGDFWILTDGTTITIAEQRNGCPAQQKLDIPCNDFNKLVRWYVRDQKPRKQ